jgi:hypothetical protein
MQVPADLSFDIMSYDVGQTSVSDERVHSKSRNYAARAAGTHRRLCRRRSRVAVITGRGFISKGGMHAVHNPIRYGTVIDVQ